jgi:hypothetical protein
MEGNFGGREKAVEGMAEGRARGGKEREGEGSESV